MSFTASFESYKGKGVTREAKTAALAGCVLDLSRTSCSDGLAPGDAWKSRNARHHLCMHLRRWEMPHLVEPMGMLVSELVTNAYRYGSGDVAVSLYLADGDMLRLSVWDGSPQCARVCTPSQWAESGRGLQIVEALVAERRGQWGVSTDGMTTWCAIPLLDGAI